MKRVHGFAAAFVLALLGGCGGADLTTGGPIVGVTNVAVEAVYVGAPVGRVADAQNIETGESIQFNLVGMQGGNRVVLSHGLWETSDTVGAYGTLAGNSGLFLAGDTSSPVQTVYTSYEGSTYSALYKVNPRQVRLSGNIFNESTSAAVGGVVLNFYNDAGLKVGQVRTNSDGTFLASIPVTTASFQVLDESLPAGFHRSFTYDGIRYDTGRFDCRVTIPVYDAGPKLLPFDILLTPTTVGSKPDPDGCAP